MQIKTRNRYEENVHRDRNRRHKLTGDQHDSAAEAGVVNMLQVSKGLSMEMHNNDVNELLKTEAASKYYAAIIAQ